MTSDHLRDQFPVTRQWIYLNHAAVAPISTPVQRAMERHLDDVATHGLVHIQDWNDLVSEARASAARLIGARRDEIAFLKNTTDGLIAAALGVRWRPGDVVVIAEREFPANVYPWMALADRGVEIRRVPERDGRLCVEDFADAMDQRTRLLSVSSVEFFTGYRNDLARLGRLCRERDVLFIVDAIQSVGALQIDVQEYGIDCLAADAHKWMMGPEGCALFYCARRAMRHIEPASIGWASVATAYDFLDCDPTLQEDARRFETGSQNTVGIAGLKAAADLLTGVGMAEVETRILALTHQLVTGLAEAGFEILSSRLDGEASGIVTCRSTTGETSTQTEQRLRKGGVIVTDRGGWLRFSPHFYNTPEEIDQTLRIVRA